MHKPVKTILFRTVALDFGGNTVERDHQAVIYNQPLRRYGLRYSAGTGWFFEEDAREKGLSLVEPHGKDERFAYVCDLGAFTDEQAVRMFYEQNMRATIIEWVVID